jgi:hypothetical protein
MSDCPEAALPAAPSDPSDARAQRLAKFQREQLIVDYLNRGVSVAEIAARVGLSEKRMRAVIREVLARRMPHPPEEFVAIQVSRLNEALLVAFSAMTGANLKAVDRVVKIVRELDRYHGFVAAQRRLPEASRTEAPVEGTMTFGAALVCRPEIALQDFEMVGFTPGIALSSEAASAAGQAREQDPAFAARHVIARSPQGDVAIQGPSDALRSPGSPRFARDDAGKPPSLSSSLGHYERPGIPPQGLEKIESAPGFAVVPEAESPDLVLSLSKDAPASSNAAACWSMLRDATRCVAPQHESREVRPAAPAGDDRPENPPQGLENIESAPGKGWPAEAAPAPDDSTPMIMTPTGWRRQNIRILLNGVAAC